MCCPNIGVFSFLKPVPPVLLFGEFEHGVVLVFGLFVFFMYSVAWGFSEFVHSSSQLVGMSLELRELLSPPSSGLWCNFHFWDFHSYGFLDSFCKFLAAHFQTHMVFDMHCIWDLIKLLFELSSKVFPINILEI